MNVKYMFLYMYRTIAIHARDSMPSHYFFFFLYIWNIITQKKLTSLAVIYYFRIRDKYYFHNIYRYDMLVYAQYEWSAPVQTFINNCRCVLHLLYFRFASIASIYYWCVDSVTIYKHNTFQQLFYIVRGFI